MQCTCAALGDVTQTGNPRPGGSIHFIMMFTSSLLTVAAPTCPHLVWLTLSVLHIASL